MVTNDFPQLTLDLSTQWRAFHRAGAPDLYPEPRATRSTSSWRGSTPTSTTASTAAASPAPRRPTSGLRRALRRARRAVGAARRRRYLVGDTITEADVRLFTTLVRFDAVYHGHFKCNRHKLTELPVLWAYARDLFQTPGSATPSTSTRSSGTTTSCTANQPERIVPRARTSSGWPTPHGRG